MHAAIKACQILKYIVMTSCQALILWIIIKIIITIIIKIIIIIII